MPDLHDLLSQARSAVHRARYVSRDLDKSSRVSDAIQVANGIMTELGIIERSVTQALDRLSGAEQLAAGDRAGKVRSDAMATSRAAAAGILMRSGSKRSQVLAYLAASNGRTDYQIQRDLKMPPSTERPRRGELVDYGLVRETPRTRWHEGTEWTVWEVTPLGSEVCLRMDAGERVRLYPPSSDTCVGEQVSIVEPEDWGDGTLF